MKVLAVFSMILAVVVSYPIVKTWTLSELSHAIETKSEPALQPYLEDALNQIMFNLFSGKEELSQYVIPSPSGAAMWTVEELVAAEADSSLSEEYRNAIIQAHSIYKQKEALGEVTENVAVVIPAMDVSVWTLADLNEALNSDNVKSELIPHLKKALSELNTSTSGENVEKTIGMVTRPGLIPHKNINLSKYSKKQKTKKDYRFKHLYTSPLF